MLAGMHCHCLLSSKAENDSFMQPHVDPAFLTINLHLSPLGYKGAFRGKGKICNNTKWTNTICIVRTGQPAHSFVPVYTRELRGNI
jgi:hypothetical protein